MTVLNVKDFGVRGDGVVIENVEFRRGEVVGDWRGPMRWNGVRHFRCSDGI